VGWNENIRRTRGKGGTQGDGNDGEGVTGRKGVGEEKDYGQQHEIRRTEQEWLSY